MLRIPKGAIYCEGEFDNTANNQNNPFDPPLTITGFDEGDEEISLEDVR